MRDGMRMTFKVGLRQIRKGMAGNRTDNMLLIS
jgi:hypothetical protein